MIKAVLFDIDGVVIAGPMFSFYLEKDYGLTIEKTKPFFSKEFIQCTLGKKDLKQELPKYLRDWGWKKTTQEFINYWFESDSKLNHDLISYIKELRKKDIMCFAATVQEKHRTDYLLKKIGLEKVFDGFFASAHLGSKKPDIEFFRKIWLKLQYENKKEVIFWDDSQLNVDAAKQFGFHSELYTDFDGFKNKMNQLIYSPAKVT